MSPTHCGRPLSTRLALPVSCRLGLIGLQSGHNGLKCWFHPERRASLISLAAATVAAHWVNQATGRVAGDKRLALHWAGLSSVSVRGGEISRVRSSHGAPYLLQRRVQGLVCLPRKEGERAVLVKL